MGVFIVKVFLEQFLPLQADAVIEAPEVQDKVKDVIAGDDPAVLRNGPAGLEAAHFRVILEEIGTVVRGLPPDSRLLRNHVQGGGLAGAVPAVEDGNRLKVQPSQPMPGQRLEGIEGVIAGSLDSHEETVLQLDIGKSKFCHVNHFISPFSSSSSSRSDCCTFRFAVTGCSPGLVTVTSITVPSSILLEKTDFRNASNLGWF